MSAYPQAEGESDVVFQAQWKCFGEQVNGGELFNAFASANTPVTYQQGAPFTPYDQLTQEQVLGWVWASGVDKTATEADVQQLIDLQINPTVVQPPLPWVTPAA
jgi:hypothetical protein